MKASAGEQLGDVVCDQCPQIAGMLAPLACKQIVAHGIVDPVDARRDGFHQTPRPITASIDSTGKSALFSSS